MLLHKVALVQRSFYTQKLLRTEAFTQRSFYTKKLLLLHTEAVTVSSVFTRRSFYAQKLLHAYAFPLWWLVCREAYTEELLHKETVTPRNSCVCMLLRKVAFVQRSFYAQTLYTEAYAQKHLCECCYTERLLNRDAVARKGFYIKWCFDRDTFTLRRLYTQKLVNTETFYRGAFTQSSFEAQTLLHKSCCREQPLHTEDF